MDALPFELAATGHEPIDQLFAQDENEKGTEDVARGCRYRSCGRSDGGEQRLSSTASHPR